MKLISVIIPCYNAHSYIIDCLNSVIYQTYKNIEIICIDDGSTDNTLNLLQKFKNEYPSILSVISTHNQGAPAARNLGLKRAVGDYIQFLDADDVIAADKFEKQIKGFNQEVDVVVSDRVQKNYNLTQVINTYFFKDIEINPLETAIKKVITTCNPLYKRQIVMELKGYDEKLSSAQDWDFHIRLVLAGYKIKYIPGIFFINRQVKGSVSSNWIKVSIQAANIIEQLKSNLEESHWMNNTIKQYLSQIYIDSAIFCSDKFQSKKYTNELKYWSQNNYGFVKSSIKRFLIKWIGIDKVIGIQRMYKKEY